MSILISKDSNLLDFALLSQEKKKEIILKNDYSFNLVLSKMYINKELIFILLKSKDRNILYNVIENHSMSFLTEVEQISFINEFFDVLSFYKLDLLLFEQSYLKDGVFQHLKKLILKNMNTINEKVFVQQTINTKNYLFSNLISTLITPFILNTKKIKGNL